MATVFQSPKLSDQIFFKIVSFFRRETAHNEVDYRVEAILNDLSE